MLISAVFAYLHFDDGAGRRDVIGLSVAMTARQRITPLFVGDAGICYIFFDGAERDTSRTRIQPGL